MYWSRLLAAWRVRCTPYSRSAIMEALRIAGAWLASPPVYVTSMRLVLGWIV